MINFQYIRRPPDITATALASAALSVTGAGLTTTAPGEVNIEGADVAVTLSPQTTFGVERVATALASTALSVTGAALTTIAPGALTLHGADETLSLTPRLPKFAPASWNR